MALIPEEFRRVTEDRIDAILHRNLSSRSTLAIWLFGKAFPSYKLVSIDHTELRKHRDYRGLSGHEMAFGETDIETTATLEQPNGCTASAGLLVAPQRYLDSAYPAGDHWDNGWDALIALEDINQVLKNDRSPPEDIKTLSEAVELTNAWNKPIPDAVQFWKALQVFQCTFYPDVPIFINRQQGAGISVWPSFYENQLAKNKREIRRKSIQIAYSGKAHMSLFVKNVKYQDFAPVALRLVEADMAVGAGASWQSIQLRVPEIDPCLSVDSQKDKLDQVFIAARRLYEFFIKNERELLSIPKFR